MGRRGVCEDFGVRRLISRAHLENRLEELQLGHEQVVLTLQQYVGAIAQVTKLLEECEESAEVPQKPEEEKQQ